MGKREKKPHPGIRKLVGANIGLLVGRGKAATASEIAKAAGVDRRTVNRIIKGEIGTSLDSIGHMADALNVSPLELFVQRGTALTGKGEDLLHGSAEQNKRVKARKIKIP